MCLEIWKNRIYTTAPEEPGSTHFEEIDTSVNSNTESNSDRYKRILYCIGLNEMSEHLDVFTDAVTDRIKIFGGAREKIKLSIALYPSSRIEWDKVDAAATDRLFNMIQSLEGENKVSLIESIPSKADETAMDYDAYYGSPSPFVPAFTAHHKPVMISDYTV